MSTTLTRILLPHNLEKKQYAMGMFGFSDHFSHTPPCEIKTMDSSESCSTGAKLYYPYLIMLYNEFVESCGIDSHKTYFSLTLPYPQLDIIKTRFYGEVDNHQLTQTDCLVFRSQLHKTLSPNALHLSDMSVPPILNSTIFSLTFSKTCTPG